MHVSEAESPSLLGRALVMAAPQHQAGSVPGAPHMRCATSAAALAVRETRETHIDRPQLLLGLDGSFVKRTLHVIGCQRGQGGEGLRRGGSEDAGASVRRHWTSEKVPGTSLFVMEWGSGTIDSCACAWTLRKQANLQAVAGPAL